MDKIMVGIAEGKIARKTQVLASYALGSCVAICLYDPKNKIAGMAHAILPRKEDAVDQGNPYKFAREGASELIRAMVNSGAEKKQITAKLVGGAGCLRHGKEIWRLEPGTLWRQRRPFIKKGCRYWQKIQEKTMDVPYSFMPRMEEFR